MGEIKIDIEILNWDSNFFNIKICAIKGTISDANELTEVLQELKKLNIKLSYYSSVIPLNELQHFSELYDIYLVDKKITYLKKINKNIPYVKSVTEYKRDYPEDALIALAIQSGIYSRFNVDKKIGRIKYEELYKEWIINSVNKKLAKEVLVYEENGIIAGFITLGEKKSIADIGIIAVDSDYRGRGIGQSLMTSAENWFANNSFNQIQVVTQGNNLPACKLYERCGYTIDKIEYFYHLWKKDNF